MTKYRNDLPLFRGRPFLTDGGLETTLMYKMGIELPGFAAFRLLESAEGIEILRNYLDDYLAIAEEYATGFVFGSVTWRANPDWGEKLGYNPDRLARINRKAVEVLASIRSEAKGGRISDLLISGCVGPRGDGYSVECRMTPDESAHYHSAQIETFAGTEADLVSAMTLNYSGEAIGIVKAGTAAGMPVVISFTVETDGRLPGGESLREAIERTDDATEGAASAFMINCAHSSHFGEVVACGESWTKRIGGIRANASALSHAELNDAEKLNGGDPVEIAKSYRDLNELLPNLRLYGGCCGTDHRHLAAIARACF